MEQACCDGSGVARMTTVVVRKNGGLEEKNLGGIGMEGGWGGTDCVGTCSYHNENFGFYLE